MAGHFDICHVCGKCTGADGVYYDCDCKKVQHGDGEGKRPGALFKSGRKIDVNSAAIYPCGCPVNNTYVNDYTVCCQRCGRRFEWTPSGYRELHPSYSDLNKLEKRIAELEADLKRRTP